MFALCWVVIEEIELLGCSVPIWLFCFITSAVLSRLIGAYSLLYSFICGGMFGILCTLSNRAVREWYCDWNWGCF